MELLDDTSAKLASSSSPANSGIKKREPRIQPQRSPLYMAVSGHGGSHSDRYLAAVRQVDYHTSRFASSGATMNQPF